jgi:hypothetical protein
MSMFTLVYANYTRIDMNTLRNETNCVICLTEHGFWSKHFLRPHSSVLINKNFPSTAFTNEHYSGSIPAQTS